MNYFGWRNALKKEFLALVCIGCMCFFFGRKAWFLWTTRMGKGHRDLCFLLLWVRSIRGPRRLEAIFPIFHAFFILDMCLRIVTEFLLVDLSSNLHCSWFYSLHIFHEVSWLLKLHYLYQYILKIPTELSG